MTRTICALLLTLIAGAAFAQTEVNYANDARRYTGSGVNDNDLLFTATGTVQFDVCMLMSTTGAVDVEVTVDGTNWSTAPLSLQDLGATTSDPVLVTVADRVYAVNGKYLSIRVRQNGATAAEASLLCWKR